MSLMDIIILVSVIILVITILYLKIVKKQSGCASCKNNSCSKSCDEDKTEKLKKFYYESINK